MKKNKTKQETRKRKGTTKRDIPQLIARKTLAASKQSQQNETRKQFQLLQN